MSLFPKGRKIIIGIIAILFLVSAVGTAGAITQEELEVMREKVEAHDRSLQILDRLHWFGDLRLRYEHNNRDNANSTANDGDSPFDTQRGRVRLRLGAKAHLYKDLDLLFRVSTGNTAATSGNQTLGGTSGKKEIDADLLYASFRPSFWNIHGLTLEGGIVNNQFMTSEVVWDEDVTLEGITEQFETQYGNTSLKLVLGQYVLEEMDRTPTTGGNQPVDDVWIAAWQGQLHQKTSFGKFKFALAFYDYQNLTDNAVTTQIGAGDGQRNSQVTATNVNTTNMRTLNLLGEWSTPILNYHLKMFGEYALNTDADAPAGNNTIADDLDTAWQ
ncbi:MAG: putative porin, partial [Nitrospinaceae bacterium]|nr:putative porin [Nitrospinaceae bacterium]